MTYKTEVVQPIDDPLSNKSEVLDRAYRIYEEVSELDLTYFPNKVEIKIEEPK